MVMQPCRILSEDWRASSPQSGRFIARWWWGGAPAARCVPGQSGGFGKLYDHALNIGFSHGMGLGKKL
ncbi:MAG: hypothetical protein KDI44_01835 [Thiothrix sp.]|nr:hypothetical protein [Thiothrix sp.]HPQ97169.1 hypothetical protein [Thiolinea sp.]